MKTTKSATRIVRIIDYSVELDETRPISLGRLFSVLPTLPERITLGIRARRVFRKTMKSYAPVTRREKLLLGTLVFLGMLLGSIGGTLLYRYWH